MALLEKSAQYVAFQQLLFRFKRAVSLISDPSSIHLPPIFAHGLRDRSFKIPLKRPIFAVIHNQA
jgi:hypothetical protein